ncbi:hypothetical protein ACFOQM_10900 [Paenibacillus sp. GCM10012307]|uniref:hypothetical protein n=1 Tax=Paenibacillus sp. GCM10012307 TaxID=3317343 RepID=UPI003617E895
MNRSPDDWQLMQTSGLMNKVFRAGDQSRFFTEETAFSFASQIFNPQRTVKWQLACFCKERTAELKKQL